MKTTIFIYEAPHLEKLIELIAGKEGEYEIVACGANIEFLLEQKAIAFRSAREMRTLRTPERLVLAKKMGERLLLNPYMGFFSYKGISLGSLSLPGLQYYLGNFLYFLDIVSHAFDSQVAKVQSFAPTTYVGPHAATLEEHNARAFIDALRLVCDEKKIPFEVIEAHAQKSVLQTRMHATLFEIRRLLFGAFLFAHNAYVRFKVPQKKLRILASELWKNIGPLIENLPEAELVLLDRTEYFNVNRASLFGARMQFVHSMSFISIRGEKRIVNALGDFELSWKRISSDRFLEESACGISLTSHLRGVLERLVRVGGNRMLREVEGSEAILKSLRPQVVLVRAGTSAQTHFAVLCEVARKLHIPSLEVQHGIFSVFEGDFTGNPSSEYIAEYGSLVREELHAHNFAPRSKYIDIGSPRFDVYARTKPKERGQGFTLLHIGPPYSPGGWNDSYDVVDYFAATAQAVREIKDVKVIIKLRATRAEEAFFKEAIARTYKDLRPEVAIFEPLADVISNADVVVSCHSTAFLEALVAKKPVVMDATLPIYKALSDADLGPYMEAHALEVADTLESLKTTLTQLEEDEAARDALSEHAGEFVQKNFLLSDGQSSKRLAEFIRKVTSSTINPL